MLTVKAPAKVVVPVTPNVSCKVVAPVTPKFPPIVALPVVDILPADTTLVADTLPTLAVPATVIVLNKPVPEEEMFPLEVRLETVVLRNLAVSPPLWVIFPCRLIVPIKV